MPVKNMIEKTNAINTSRYTYTVCNRLKQKKKINDPKSIALFIYNQDVYIQGKSFESRLILLMIR
jgi:predicted Zn-dependent protease